MASLLSGLWLVVVARYLPIAEFGDLSILLSVAAVIVLVSDLGLPFILADAVARAGLVSTTTLKNVICRRLVAGALAGLVTAVLYLTVASASRLVVPAVFAVSIMATTVHSSLSAALRGLGRFGTEAANDVLSRAGVLLVGWVWLARGGGLLAAVTLYAAADVLSALVIGTKARGWAVEGDDGIDPARMRLRGTMLLSTSRLLAALYYRVDLWLVALFSGAGAAALYAAPYRVLDGLLLVPRAVGSVSVTHAAVNERRGSAATSSTRLALGGVLSVAVFALPLMIFSGPAITTAFGERYADSAAILAVLMASALPGAVVLALMPTSALRETRRFTVIMAVALGSNVVINLLLIPTYGPIAAAWTTLVCQVGLAVALYRSRRRRPGGLPDADPPVPLSAEPEPADYPY